jgi:hypothetical protein
MSCHFVGWVERRIVSSDFVAAAGAAKPISDGANGEVADGYRGKSDKSPICSLNPSYPSDVRT